MQIKTRLIVANIILLIILSLVVPLTATTPIFAAPCNPSLDENGDEKTFLGLPTWYKYLDGDDSSGKCTPILSGDEACSIDPESDECKGEKVNSALPIGLAVLEIMLRLAGMVAVVMIFVAGFRFITSDGSPDKAAGAKKTVINAIIGLAIVVLSTGLVAFIGSRLS